MPVFLYLFYLSWSTKRVNQRRVWKHRPELTTAVSPVSLGKEKKSHLKFAYIQVYFCMDIIFHHLNCSINIRPLKSLTKLHPIGSCATRILYSAYLGYMAMGFRGYEFLSWAGQAWVNLSTKILLFYSVLQD